MPVPDLPSRDVHGPHSCDSCPGGSCVDGSVLVDGDALAMCFIECCSAPNKKHPEASTMWHQDEWHLFLRRLRQRDIVDDEFLEVLREASHMIETETGLNIWALQRWLVRRTGYDEHLGRFDKASEALRGALHGVNIQISFRGLESLSRRELYTYQVLLGEYEHGVADCKKRVLERIRRAEYCNSDGAGIHDHHTAGTASPDHGTSSPLPQTPEEFQWSRGPEIERHLREVRVGAVSLPAPREQRVLVHSDWGMRQLVGRSVQNGAEIRVLEIPWTVHPNHAERAQEFANRLEALKQLALSRYFPDYLGCDFVSYSDVALHFLPLQRCVCVRQLVTFAGPLVPEHMLFKYWARELLKALRDYLYQCCHTLSQDITLQHVFVFHEGLQLQLQGVPFGERRGQVRDDLPEQAPHGKWRDSFEATEQRLITMYGHMLIELLCGQQKLDGPVQSLHRLDPPLRLIVKQALNACNTMDYFLGMSPGQISSVADAAGPAGTGGESAEATARKDVVNGLAGGFVSAEIDEYDTGEEYRLWWARPAQDPPFVLPNVEGTVDADPGGACPVLREDWMSSDDNFRVGRDPAAALRSADGDVPRLEWEPNRSLFTMQEMLNHPALSSEGHDTLNHPAFFQLWDEYLGRYEANHAKQLQLGRFFDGHDDFV